MTTKNKIVINFGIIKIKLTLNNLFLTLTDFKGNVLASKHSGLRFKSYKRKTPYVASVVLEDIINRIKSSKWFFKLLIIQIQGHEYRRNVIKSIIKKLASYKYKNILCIQYRLKKMHNGIRLKKKRRI